MVKDTTCFYHHQHHYHHQYYLLKTYCDMSNYLIYTQTTFIERYY